MLLHTSHFATGGDCLLTYEEAEHWLRATWQGPISTEEAMQGAAAYLDKARPLPCAYLLNDNRSLRGPWFDSIEWLERAWLPQALQLGLRYVAHVVQADTKADVLTLTFPHSLAKKLELQIFQAVPEAEEWLRNCQRLA
jgi:hypothetical protein